MIDRQSQRVNLILLLKGPKMQAGLLGGQKQTLRWRRGEEVENQKYNKQNFVNQEKKSI